MNLRGHQLPASDFHHHKSTSCVMPEGFFLEPIPRGTEELKSIIPRAYKHEPIKNGLSVTVKGTVGSQTSGIMDIKDCEVVK